MKYQKAEFHLRKGCYPASGWRHPPHDYGKNRDGVYIRLIYPDQLEDCYGMMVINGFHNGEPRLAVYEGGSLYEVMTSNGFRCYTTTEEIALWFLALASAGNHAIQRWMNGMRAAEAEEEALAEWQSWQEYRARQPSYKLTHSLDDLEIDI